MRALTSVEHNFVAGGNIARGSAGWNSASGTSAGGSSSSSGSSGSCTFKAQKEADGSTTFEFSCMNGALTGQFNTGDLTAFGFLGAGAAAMSLGLTPPVASGVGLAVYNGCMNATGNGVDYGR